VSDEDAPRFALDVPPRLARVLRDGVRVPEREVDPETEDLQVAFVTVPDRRADPAYDEQVQQLVHGLRARGTPATVWRDLRDWSGADVAVAVGWRSVPTVLRLPDLGARALLVLEDEVDALPASSDREWAGWAYRQGLTTLCAGDWLARRLADDFGAEAHVFVPGVDPERHHPLPTHRREDLVVAHVAPALAQAAAPMTLLALEELHARRPEVELVLFGEERRLATRFPQTELGVADAPARNHVYSEATVGVALSVGAPSPVILDMLACGLPVVSLRAAAVREAYAEGTLELALHDPGAVADAIERLLDDLALRAERARGGLELAGDRSWAAASADVEAALRLALSRTDR
jgi:glycosyltransferase involved in cell wall biosynthesis